MAKVDWNILNARIVSPKFRKNQYLLGGEG